MTKKISLIAVIILLAGTLFTACNKQEEIVEEQNQDPVLERILDFKADVENPSNLKSGGGTIAVEDAVWVVEATLNYSYCIITEEQAEAGANAQIIDSLFFEINVTDGQVSYNDAITAYLDFEAEMQNMLNAVDYEVKFFHIVDVEFEEGSFKTMVQILYKEPEMKSTTGGLGFYEITHDWQWGHSLGTCEGTNIGRDATDEIDRWITWRTWRRGILANVYYTDYYGTVKSAEDMQGHGIDMFLHYKDLPDGYSYPIEYCIQANECNYYA